MGVVRGPAETAFVCGIFLLQLRLEFAQQSTPLMLYFDCPDKDF